MEDEMGGKLDGEMDGEMNSEMNSGMLWSPWLMFRSLRWTMR